MINIARYEIKGKGRVAVLTLMMVSLLSATVFAGNMAYSYSFTFVKSQGVHSGVIQTKVEAVGEVRAESGPELKMVEKSNPSAGLVRISANGDWKLREVNVGSGDYVTKGMILAKIDMTEVETSIQKKELEIRRLELEIERRRNTNAIPNDISVYENEATQALNELKSLQENLQLVKVLVDAKAESLRSLKSAEEAVNKAVINYENKKAIVEQKKVDAYKLRNENLILIKQSEADIAIKKLDIESIKRNTPINGEIRAELDGVVKSVNVQAGSSVDAGRIMIEINTELSPVAGSQANKSGLIVHWKLEGEKGRFLNIGDPVTIEAKYPNPIKLSERVSSVQNLDNEKSIAFTCLLGNSDHKIQPGSQVKVSATQKGSEHDKVIPKNAVVFNGNNSGYVYVVKNEKSLLGNSHYVQRVEVTIDDMSESECAVTGNLNPGEEVVIYNNKPLSNGMRVRY